MGSAFFIFTAVSKKADQCSSRDRSFVYKAECIDRRHPRPARVFLIFRYIRQNGSIDILALYDPLCGVDRADTIAAQHRMDIRIIDI